MRHTMLREKRRRVRSEQHCDGRVTAGKSRERRDDCCALPVIDGPTRSRIQQVAVPATIELEIALVIAARCDGTVAKLDGSDHCGVDARMGDAYAPRRAIGPRTNHAHVTAEVDEARCDAMIGADRR